MKKKIDFILILIGFYIIPIDSSYLHDQITNNKNLIVLTKKDNSNLKNQFFNNNHNNKNNVINNSINYHLTKNYANNIKADSLMHENNNIKFKIKRYKRDKLNKESNKNYYYEEQKPLVILPSEAGPIGIKNFVENFNKNNLTNNYLFNNYKNEYLATTPSSFELNEMSSMNNDEYNDSYEYESTENDENRQFSKEYEMNDNSNNKQDSFGSIMTQAKNLWDIYSALNTAFNVITHSQSNNNLRSIVNKTNFDSSTENINNYQLNNKNGNNIRKENFHDNYSIDRRTKNYTKMNNFNFTLTKRDISKADNAVQEGRYIKGDPLKGYYDFVITEGSYKFWAAFQLATAVLIIYSTFAAIYYSKVNPLVGDYDYVDYLGGGRSLSDDSDFIDDNADNIPYSKSSPKLNDNEKDYYSFNKLMPKLGHSIKFILESIDKLPHNE